MQSWPHEHAVKDGEVYASLPVGRAAGGWGTGRGWIWL